MIFGVEKVQLARVLDVLAGDRDLDLVPAWPPIGMTVSRRGSGSVTCWARRGGSTARGATR